MKRIKILKKKKNIVVMVSILIVLCACAVFAVMSGDRPEEVTAVTFGSDQKNETVKSGRNHTRNTEQENDTEEQKRQEGKTKEDSDKVSADSAAQSKDGARSSEQKSDASYYEKKNDTETNKSEPTKPAHVHDYQPQEGTETVTYEVPIIGDWCYSCNKDYTGMIEKHILETSCRGYDTDVVVGYETVTEEVPCIYHICSCGAVKQ